METGGTPEIETALPNRSFINLLTTLTFIGSVLGFVFCLMSYMFWGGLEQRFLSTEKEDVELQQKVTKIVGDQELSTYTYNGQREAFFKSMSHYYLLAALANVLGVVGAFLMRAYRRRGFFIYVFSHIVFLVSPFVVVLNYHAKWGETAILAFFAGLFILLYSRQLKHFH